tara:strand:- start:1039 stop:2118 length:1080 start_codon:yes stop_codon:yes gene_type:complete
MIKKYHQYITKVFLNNLLIISLVFIVISFIISVFEEIKFFEDKEVEFYYPIILTLLNVPSVLYEIFPFIFLIAAKFFYINLVDKNELEILKNNGIDNLKILSILSIISFFVGLIIIVFYYTFASNLKNQYLIFKNQFSGENQYLAIVNENGLWVKENVDNNINIINANSFEGDFLEDISITQVDDKYKTIKTIIASKADISNKTWILKNGKIFSSYSADENFDKHYYKSTIDNLIISKLFSNLGSLNIYELHKLSNSYNLIGYSTTEIEIHLHKIYSLPFYLWIMTIVGSILMIKLKFIKTKFFTVIIGVLISVIVYYLNYFSSLFGSNDTIPIALSVWLPIIILFLSSAIGVIKINEI